jgi:hypothetical protein
VIFTSFEQGSLVRPPVEDEPDEPPGDIAALLDEADTIVTAAGPEIVAEVEAEREGRRWWQFWKRRAGGEPGGPGVKLSSR